MRLSVRPWVVAAILTVVGASAHEARAQVPVPYGPYSLPRGAFYQNAPSYYPALPNTTTSYGRTRRRYRRSIFSVPRVRNVYPYWQSPYSNLVPPML